MEQWAPDLRVQLAPSSRLATYKAFNHTGHAGLRSDRRDPSLLYRLLLLDELQPRRAFWRAVPLRIFRSACLFSLLNIFDRFILAKCMRRS